MAPRISPKGCSAHPGLHPFPTNSDLVTSYPALLKSVAQGLPLVAEHLPHHLPLGFSIFPSSSPLTYFRLEVLPSASRIAGS